MSATSSLAANCWPTRVTGAPSAKTWPSGSERVWNRDLYDAQIVTCPNTAVVGKSFGQVADQRGITPADALLDLAVAHGRALRWRTTIANDRDGILDRLARSPGVQIGFADSGAYLRNMAFYNSPGCACSNASTVAASCRSHRRSTG